MKNYICVASIVGVHGIRGDIKIKTFTESPENILKYGKLSNKDGTVFYDIKILSQHKGMLLCKIAGVSDRTSAEKVVGTDMFVRRDAMPSTKDGEFYMEDMAGMVVINAGGEVFGRVIAAHNFGAGDILEIKLQSSGKTQMFAFNNENFPDVDIEKNQIVISLMK